jgi:hypothetical protein
VYGILTLEIPFRMPHQCSQYNCAAVQCECYKLQYAGSCIGAELAVPGGLERSYGQCELVLCGQWGNILSEVL